MNNAGPAAAANCSAIGALAAGSSRSICWGVINGVQTFAPDMIKQGTPAAIVNTGSKQGITCPPGDTAYNVSKAGVKVMTEGLANELRNTEGCRVSAHLLIPGFVFTSMTRGSRTEKPAAAWTPEQVIDFMLDSMGRATSTSSAPTTTCRGNSTKRILGRLGTLSRTGRRSPAGIQTAQGSLRQIRRKA